MHIYAHIHDVGKNGKNCGVELFVANHFFPGIWLVLIAGEIIYFIYMQVVVC